MPNKNISSYTGLILVSGEDRPGITEKIMSTLSQFAVSLKDIEQLTIRGRLLLTILIALDQAHSEAIMEDLNNLQKELNLDIAIDFANHLEGNQRNDLLKVVIVGEEIRPSAIAVVAAEVARLDGNIEDIRRISTSPITAFELILSLTNSSLSQVQSCLTKVAIENKIDLAVEPGGSASKLKRLVLLDMDSTLIENEVIDILARYAGKSEYVSQITERAMSGELDFVQSLKERVNVLAGLDESVLVSARNEISLTKGAKKLIEQLHRFGHKVGVVSGGFLNVISPILQDLKVDYYKANELEVKNGKLTGNLVGQIVDGSEKLSSLKEFAETEGIDLQQTIAIGDGTNDLEMIQAAGLGIAFNAKPKVVASADSTISFKDLSAILLLIGITD